MNSPFDNPEIICAQATPAGRGGVAMVRVSGRDLSDLIKQVIGQTLLPRKATYLSLKDTAGQLIDECIVIYFPAPHSFTGEDVMELHCHGSPIIIDNILQNLIAKGARLAKPGEFSERAFLNGKIDLTQAEAIADLINATSTQAARSALRSLQGDFSSTIRHCCEKLIEIRTYVEAMIDFSEEEIEFLNNHHLKTKLQDLLAEVGNIQKKAQQGSLLRDGINVVITGKPNVGKSSLLNALSGKQLSIVTPVPGTTRDVIRETIQLDGLLLQFVDTAGLRESEDCIEQEGVRRAYQELEKADLILFMRDISEVSEMQTNEWEGLAPCPLLIIDNKIDRMDIACYQDHIGSVPRVALSVKTGEGLALLIQEIKRLAGYSDNTENVFLARRRHLDALQMVHQAIQKAQLQLQHPQCLELIAEDLRLAQVALSEITGEYTPDDLLGTIFASFCIGK